MRKSVLIFVALAVLASTMPASAQIFAGQYGPADQLLQDNLRMVDRWMWYGDMYGYTRGGNFYGMYGRDGQRLSRPVKIAIVGAELGATIGYAKGGGKGALIGAGLGAAPGLIAWALSRGDKQNEIVVDLPDQIPPMPRQVPQVPSGRENGWNDRLRDQTNSGRNPWFGGYRGCLEQGIFTLKNETGEVILIFLNGKPYVSLLPGQSECGPWNASYDAVMVVAGVENYTAVAGTPRAKPEGRKGGLWVWR